MGRLGKLPVQVPQGVTAEVADGEVKIKGPKGSLARKLPKRIIAEVTDDGVLITKKGQSKVVNALQGTIRAHIANMVQGVTEGWSKQLEVNGPGYRAEAKPEQLTLTVGYSHPVILEAPEGITFKVEKNVITVEGADKEKVGHISALVREARKPNVYSGSGVKYLDEVVRRKAGKQAGAKAE